MGSVLFGTRSPRARGPASGIPGSGAEYRVEVAVCGDPAAGGPAPGALGAAGPPPRPCPPGPRRSRIDGTPSAGGRARRPGTPARAPRARATTGARGVVPRVGAARPHAREPAAMNPYKFAGNDWPSLGVEI